MNFHTRILPTREAMVRNHEGRHTAQELAAVDLSLSLLLAADIVRGRVYGKYMTEVGLSEGNIALLMALNQCDGLGVLELSKAMGVKPATASVMLRRMASRLEPLVDVVRDASDGRGKIVKLSEKGRILIRERLLPGFFEDFGRFASILSFSEQEQLGEVLKRLITSGSGPK